MNSAFTNAQNKVSIIPITAVVFSIVSNTNSTYTGSAQSVTVVSVTPSGATFSTSTTTATNAGQVASTTITGIGDFTGSFTSPNLTIVAVTITGTAANPSATYNAGSQSGTVITGVTAGATFSGSVTASGTNAGSYTSSITGTGNYQGTVNGGTFTINKATCTLTGTSGIEFCPPFSGFNGQRMFVTGCGGLLSGGIGTLTVYLVDKVTGATSVAPVLPDSQVDGVWNGSTNPKTGLSNGINTASVLFPSGTYYYGFSFGGDSNYNASGVGALNGDSCNT